MKQRFVAYRFNLKAIPIYYDNTSTIAISYNPVMDSCSKNINIRDHFYHRPHSTRKYHRWTHTNRKQLYDIFTNPFYERKFNSLLLDLEILNSWKEASWYALGWQDDYWFALSWYASAKKITANMFAYLTLCWYKACLTYHMLALWYISKHYDKPRVQQSEKKTTSHMKGVNQLKCSWWFVLSTKAVTLSFHHNGNIS